jgi:hypothetical protein
VAVGEGEDEVDGEGEVSRRRGVPVQRGCAGRGEWGSEGGLGFLVGDAGAYIATTPIVGGLVVYRLLVGYWAYSRWGNGGVD